LRCVLAALQTTMGVLASVLHCEAPLKLMSSAQVRVWILLVMASVGQNNGSGPVLSGTSERAVGVVRERFKG
jgi:hypothetical protein